MQAFDSMRIAVNEIGQILYEINACVLIRKENKLLLSVSLKVIKNITEKTIFCSFLIHFSNLFPFRFCNTLKGPQEKHLAPYLE